MNLDLIRKEIDKLDDLIAASYCKRLDLVKCVADFKAQNALPIQHTDRESAVYARLFGQNPQQYQSALKALYSHIFTQSKLLQTTIIDKNSLPQYKTFCRESYPAPSVACQGIEGAYSHMACEKMFSCAKLCFRPSFEDVFDSVLNGETEFGIIPIENSTAGGVNEVYNLLQKNFVYVVDSIKLEISHCLLAKRGETNLQFVHSHPQALMQCSAFIKDHALSSQIEDNTAKACRTVSTLPQPGHCAIGNEKCAQLYDLEIVQRAIQNARNNYTRFVVISKDFLVKKSATTASFVLRLRNKPNSLLRLLDVFSFLGIDILRLESRSISDTDFAVNFYLDAAVNLIDDRFSNLLGVIKDYCEQVRLLGVY